jgi:flagellar basal-body rod protein FlgC
MADVRPPSNSAQAIAATALRAEQARMRIIAENIANANSTSRTPTDDRCPSLSP